MMNDSLRGVLRVEGNATRGVVATNRPHVFVVPEHMACSECGSVQWRTGTVYTVGSLLARWLNIKSRKFSTSTCTVCGFTEFYERKASVTSNILDILIR
eukprot:ANDGO_00387.mRNA.1 Uncharacterized protein YpzJ